MATDSIHAPFSHSRFRALIADDQQAAREAISRVLEEDASIEIVSECADGNEALAAIAEHAPDMLFVDVQLPAVAGFQVVESSRERIPAVVFMSALDRFAARAFDADAADYVIKPFHDERLLQAVERAKLRVQMERSGIVTAGAARPQTSGSVAPESPKYLERLALRNGDRIFFQKVQFVDSFTSAANYIHVHCGAQTHRLRSTMADLERKLDPKHFVRIHRCTIINIECLREFRPLPHGDYLVKLIDGKELTMSRNYRQQFRKALAALSYIQ
ncbi:MAG TPA: LytTR family DNA-binding domain-containing protein [Terriglobales bacterium]|jgi:two-component system LytT family response regulator|nr:LytTR family DNA-binding domain-containing protein [Terriglobales bacterium]